ncbi:hypothetical protein FRB96_007003 [Tulasnella sp. 330]|nr:hypothetical protein FRB96_007003 [Tulasnella sp. 330]
MPSLWKKIKQKLGRKKKKPKQQEEDVGDAEYIQPMSARVTAHSVQMEGGDNWRPAATGMSWDNQYQEQYTQSPLDMNEPVVPSHAVHEYNYDPQDAFSTMDGLIHPEDPPTRELPNPPRSHTRSRSTATNPERRKTHIRSIDSLSTISADAPAGDGGAAESSIGQMDDLIRRSLAPTKTGSDMRRSITTATKVNVIPLGVFTRTSAPLRTYHSLAASPVGSKHNTISYVTASPPPIPQSAAFPEEFQKQQQQQPLQPEPETETETKLFRNSAPPAPRSEQLGLDIIGASKASLVGSPERGSKEGSLKSLSPLPLSPIPDYPAVVQQAFRLQDGGNSSRSNSSIESLRSRTYQHALNNPIPIPDPLPRLPRKRVTPIQRMPTVTRPYMPTVKLEDSEGRALVDVQMALYGTHRPAAERFYWTLPPEHDPRVLGLLTWIDRMKSSLASLAVHKFVETRTRGALLMNVNYRVGTKSLTSPAVDWITFRDSQRTLDRVLQENIATYDPTQTALVFAFLASKTKNSVGMWLRKLAVPETVRSQHYERITATKAGINPDDLLVHVEATPESPPGTKSYPIPRRAPFVPETTTKRPSPPFLVQPLKVETVPIPVANVQRVPTQIHPRTRAYIPAREPKAPQHQRQSPPDVFQRNDTIRVVEAAPLVTEVNQTQPMYYSPPIPSVSIPPPARATASSHIGSRVHVFGEDRDRHRLLSQTLNGTQTQTQMRTSNTVSRHQREHEVLLEESNSDRTTLSGAPLPVEIVEVKPVKKRPIWKRLLGIGKNKDKDKQRRVLVRDRGKFGAENGDGETKKSFVEWD